LEQGFLQPEELGERMTRARLTASAAQTKSTDSGVQYLDSYDRQTIITARSRRFPPTSHQNV
jgi:hypothetical protein